MERILWIIDPTENKKTKNKEEKVLIEDISVKTSWKEYFIEMLKKGNVPNIGLVEDNENEPERASEKEITKNWKMKKH